MRSLQRMIEQGAAPLWTREEGRSDLTLSVTAIKQGETYTVEVDDLHVL